METLRPALQQNVEEWSCFERDLMEVSLHATRVRCALQHQPLFSLKQAEGQLDHLQVSRGAVHHIWYTCAHESSTAAPVFSYSETASCNCMKLKAPPSSFDRFSEGVSVHGRHALSTCHSLYLGFWESKCTSEVKIYKR